MVRWTARSGSPNSPKNFQKHLQCHNWKNQINIRHLEEVEYITVKWFVAVVTTIFFFFLWKTTLYCFYFFKPLVTSTLLSKTALYGLNSLIPTNVKNSVVFEGSHVGFVDSHFFLTFVSFEIYEVLLSDLPCLPSLLPLVPFFPFFSSYLFYALKIRLVLTSSSAQLSPFFFQRIIL